MSFFLDTLIDNRYHDSAVYRDAETATTAARRMPLIDGWRVYRTDRKTFNPVKRTTQPRVNSQAAFDAQVEFAVRNAQQRLRDGEPTPVKIHVWPAGRTGYSNDFRRAVALALLGHNARDLPLWKREYLESALRGGQGYEFVEVNPDDWDPRVSCEDPDEATLDECPSCGALFFDDDLYRCPNCAGSRS